MSEKPKDTHDPFARIISIWAGFTAERILGDVEMLIASQQFDADDIDRLVACGRAMAEKAQVPVPKKRGRPKKQVERE